MFRKRRRSSRIQQVEDAKPIFDRQSDVFRDVPRPRALFPGSPGIYADDEAIFTEPRRRFRTHRGSGSDLSRQEVCFPTFC